MSWSPDPSLDCQKIAGDSVQVKVNRDWTGELRNIVYLVNVNIIAELSRSGVPWVRKCGKLAIQENLVIT